MVEIKKCKSKKSNKSKKSKKTNKRSRRQRGGMDKACLSNYTNDRVMYGNGVANTHNTNPQASLDLDNKFMGYGGTIPLGSSFVGGASKCGNEGSGSNKFTDGTFKEYLNNLNKDLDMTMGGGKIVKPKNKSKNKSKSRRQRQHQGQRGSGYTTDPSEFVGGLPVYKKYDDCCPPTIIGGKLNFSAPDQPSCGLGAIRGGGKKSKSKSKSKSKKRNQRGGQFTTFHSSKPAEYDSAFNGPPSVFNYPEDMSKRDFGQYTPDYTPNAI